MAKKQTNGYPWQYCSLGGVVRVNITSGEDIAHLGELDQTLLRDFLWKCTFEFRNSSGELCHIEELFVVRCTVLRGKAMFTNFGFRFFNGPEYRKRVIEHKKAEEKGK